MAGDGFMFDRIVITAANAAQAKGYIAQTKHLGNVSVIADPGGRRVGSLGATVNLLRKLKLSGRVLVCHSGGDARRTPGYATMGKAFIPLRDGRSLFEHIVESMERIPIPKAGGLLVVSGDVLLGLDASKIDFSRSGVTGVAYPDGVFQARRHGVYLQRKGTVTDFLQKPQVTEGVHLIDTGILFIDWPTAEKMKQLPISGDIYEEFPKLLLAGFAPFHVNVVKKCTFFHIGSSRELLDRLGDGKTYVDAVHCELDLAGGNVVTNIPAGRFKKLKLGKNECFTCLPVGKNGWYDLRYKIDDNFKTDGLWEKHGLGEKLRQIDYGRLLEMRTADCGYRVTAPVRIDLAGGWSDTPPICNAEGGTVLNVAVTLDGKRPIEVVVRSRRDKLVRVVSKDLGKRRVFKSAEEIADHADPHDWCALVKSALTVTGFVFGSRGLDIVISADLPKGSGMGTSSILGAATIAALLGRTDAAEIGELTLRLEQEMRTGGGWQDQFGGLIGGFKLLKTHPGTRQKVDITKITPSSSMHRALRERGLLYFTGQKRMARNILRKVLAFYAENPHNFARILVDALKDGAEKGAKALAAGDMRKFAEAVNGYWRDKKLLDAGSTNDRVEAIIERIRLWTDAVTLVGAGGGGFMFILAKRISDVPKIRAALDANRESRFSRFYDFDFDETGLTLERL
jgi:Predicted kinase related to galactokinase and mevalonate kinase